VNSLKKISNTEQRSGLRGGGPSIPMSIFSWNNCGLGKEAAVNELRDFANVFARTTPCVVESQQHRGWVEGLASTLGYGRGYDVSSSSSSIDLGIF
jgi:hypothetical protein